MLLMRFRCKNGFEEPSSVVHLAYVPDLESCHGLTHDRNLLRAIYDLLYCDGMRIACVKDTLVVPDGNKHTAIIEDRPVLDDQCVDLLLQVSGQVGYVQILAHALTVKGFIERKVEQRVSDIKWWSRMLEFPEDRPTINIVQEHVKFVRLIREASIVDEDVLNSTAALWLVSNTDRRAGRVVR